MVAHQGVFSPDTLRIDASIELFPFLEYGGACFLKTGMVMADQL